MTDSPKNKFDTKLKIFFLDGDCTDKLKNGLEVVHRWVEWKLFQIPLTAALKWNATLTVKIFRHRLAFTDKFTHEILSKN